MRASATFPCAALLMVLGLLLVVAGCGARPSAHAVAPRPNPVATTAAEQAVVRDYLAYWKAFLATSESSGEPMSMLARHTAGVLLATLHRNLTITRGNHQVSEGQVGHSVRAVTDDGQIARVTDCVDLNGWLLYDTRTGRPLPRQLTARQRQLVVYALARSAGTWKATAEQVIGSC